LTPPVVFGIIQDAMVVCGKDFSGEMISRIQTKVNAEPELSRRQLSRQICEWMDWRKADGGWREGSCRKALALLNRKKILILPRREQICVQRRQHGEVVEVPEVSCGLRELGEISVRPVRSRHSAESKIVQGLLQQHHPLGAGKLRGAQLRYVIHSSRYGYLGVLTFSSSVWAMAKRDKHIGWSEEARRRNLQHVVCNDRFLIVGSVQVKNLASHVLASTVKRLAQDWEQRYKVRPVLVETFVNQGHYKGTCYTAANWTAVGQTSGRRDGIGKEIFLFALSPDWRERLCAEGPKPRLGETGAVESPLSWAHAEFGRVRFYDQRLKERLYKIAEDFHGCPQGLIPEASGSKARAMGAYRFFENPKVSMNILLESHTEATIDRIRQHKIVLAPQDTTTLNYSTHPTTEGLGPTGTKADKAVGLLLHDTMAFTEQGTPLGVLDAQCWARDPEDRGKRVRCKQLPIEQKESIKWLRSFRKVAEVQKACPNTKLISIGDRESDIYELFQEATRDADQPGLLVRMNREVQRKVGGLPLWEFMSGRPIEDILPLHIPHSGSRKARDTFLDIRFAEIQLQPPKRLKGCAPIRAWAVYACEQSQYVSNGDPLDWMLLTTVEVTCFDQAAQRIQWYARRWGIEVFHRTLKSGCRIKDRQLGTAHGLQACLGIDMVVAWRVYHLMMLARTTPQSPCTVYFQREEWLALCCYITKSPIPPKQPPSLSDAVHMVGTMGGHLGRKLDGPPGAQTLWRGLQRLDPAAEVYRVLTNAPPLYASDP
jgi:hypothetical protein